MQACRWVFFYVGFTVSLLIPSLSIFSQYPPVTQRLQYSSSLGDVVVSSNQQVQLPSLSSTQSDLGSLFTLTFGVDYASDVMPVGDKIYEVDVKIEYHASGSSVLQSQYETLILDGNSGNGTTLLNVGVDKRTVLMGNVKDAKVIVLAMRENTTAVSFLNHRLYLDLELYPNVQGVLSSVVPGNPTVSEVGVESCTNGSSSSSEFLVSWTPITGAVEYQLEYVFVNDYGVSAGSYLPMSSLHVDFRRNSTRVTTVDASYRVSNLFDHGYVCFRYRGIGVDGSTGGVVYGPWSLVDGDHLVSSVSGLGGAVYGVSVGHEQGLNWQSTQTYAEGGKKKEVVTYADGSMRSRQVVTRINTTNSVVVGETYYDYQGRAALQILPSPVSDLLGSCSESSSSVALRDGLRFYPSFNKAEGGLPITPYLFDRDLSETERCSPLVLKLDSASGAGKYYSANNVRYGSSGLARAQGYAYSRVAYTPDNTGRVREQGGVGQAFQLGSEHTTRSFYGGSSQVELDRLFGSEVGYSEHYRKVLVLDGNGQVSVSYMNQEDKVIATALAGSSPENLIPLASSESEPQELYERMLPHGHLGGINNGLSGDGKERSYITTVVLSSPSDLVLNYDLSVLPLGDGCMVEGWCASCVYDLSISVRDDCGSYLGGLSESVVGHVGQGEGGALSFYSDCDSYDMNGSGMWELTLSSLPVGSYEVSKVLRVNESALEHYVSQYTNPQYNTCMHTYEDYLSEYVSQIDSSGCVEQTCETCLSSLGTLGDYMSSGRGSADDYAQELSFCHALCGDVSPCSNAFSMLRMDVSPGGQYGQYEGDASTYALSVFNDSNHLSRHLSLGGLEGTWRSPRYYDTSVGGFVTGYYSLSSSSGVMERSRIAVTSLGGGVYSPQVVSSGSVFLGLDGVYYVYPEDLLLLSDFLSYWTSDWSLSLVLNHPEYVYYTTCLEIDGGVNGDDGVYVFDGGLSNQQTRAQAISSGYLSSSGVPTDWFSSTGVLQDYFVSSGNYGVYGTSLQGEWDHYYVNTTLGIDLSMAEFAALSVRGVGYLGATSLPASLYAFGSGSNTTQLENEWSFLRTLYLTRKQHWVSKYMDAQANSSGVSGVNDCIGNSAWICPVGYLGFYGGGVTACSNLNRDYYVSKVIRFGGDEDVTSLLSSSGVGTDYNTASYHEYEQTGLCPVASRFSQVLQELVSSGELYASSSVSLQDLGSFPALYVSLHEGDVSSSDPYSNYDWMWNTSLSSLSSSVLTASLYRSSLGVGGGWSGLVSLSKDTCSWSWDEVVNMGNFHYLGDSSGYERFSVEVLVLLPSGLTRVDELQGLTDLVSLGGCRFDTQCTLSSYGNHLLEVLNVQQGFLTSSGVGSLGGCTSCSSSHAVPASYLPVGMATWLGAGMVDTSGYYVWYSSSSTPALFIRSVGSSYPRVKLEITGSVSSSGGAGLSFGALPSDAVFKTLACDHEHYFTLEVYSGDTLWNSFTGGSFIELSGTEREAAPVCDCGFPVSVGCIGQGYAMERSVGAWMDAVFSADAQGHNYWDRMGQVPTLDATLVSTLFLSPSDYGVVGVEQYDSASGVDSLIYDYSSCRLVLWSDGLDGVTSTWSGLHDVFGFHADTSSALPSTVHSFSFSAVNELGDTLRVGGSSACLSLERCQSCDTTHVASETMALLSSFSVSDTAQWSDGGTQEYKQYLEALDQYNLNYGYAQGDEGFIAAIDYKTFYEQGSKYTLSMYLDKLLFYMGVDTTYDRGVLSDLATFSKEYGNYVDGMKEYALYSELMLEYNGQRLSQDLSLLAPEGEMNFLKSSYGVYVKDYSNYLGAVVSTTSGAQPLSSWVLGLDSVVSLSESFGVLYGSYVEAYQQWDSVQVYRLALGDDQVCTDYKSRTLYLQEDFEKLGYGGSVEGQQALQAYIAEIALATQTGDCIGLLKELSSLQGVSSYALLRSTSSSCQTLYLNYLSAVSRYNSSSYASLNISRQLLDPVLSYSDFMTYDLCGCVESYMAYLESYSGYSSSTTGVTPAVGILYFEGCGLTLPEGYADKRDCYSVYEEAYYAYNDWAVRNEGSAIVGDMVDSKVFVNEDLCSCVDDYAAYLQSIADGVRNLEEGEKGPRSLLDFCGSGLPGCVLGSDIVLSLPVLDSLPYEDPCLAALLSQAAANAQWSYAHQVDSLASAFTAAYIAHCMNSLQESFSRTWEDQEYHYTLYYYDQAGNLIKTVPPQGVVRLPLTSSEDALSEAIASDRASGERSVYTQHGMATHYYYNSLNQLVGQRLPDHEAMDLSSVEDVLGVGYTSSSSAGGSSVQLVDEHVGYGVMDGGKRLYRTQDGGLTWEEDMGVSGADVWDICLESSGVKGYMVGDGGQVYYTNSGGMQWEEVALPELAEYTQWRGVGSTVSFTSGTPPLSVGGSTTTVETVVVGEHRVASLTATGVWHVDSPSVFSDVDLEKVVSDGNNHFYAVGNRTQVLGGESYRTGVIYVSDAVYPLSWQAVSVLPTSSSLGIHYAGVLSSGVQGSLRVGSADGSIRRLVETSAVSEYSGLSNVEVLEAITLNASGAQVALLRNAMGIVSLQYRSSGADSVWQVVPGAPQGLTQLTSLRMQENGVSQFLGLCGGTFNNGKVYLFSYGTQWSVYALGVSNAEQVAVVRKDVSGAVAQAMAYVTSTKNIYLTQNVQAPVNAMLFPKSWTGGIYAGVGLCDLGSGGLLVARLSTTGTLSAVRVNPNNTETTISIPSSLSSGGMSWKKVLFGKVGSQNYLYVYGQDGSGNWRVRRANVSSTTGVLSSVSSAVNVVANARIGFGEDKLWMSNDQGVTLYANFSTGNMAYVSYSPQALRAADGYVTGGVLVGGSDGDVYDVFSSSTVTASARQLKTQTRHDIMGLSVVDGANYFYSSGRNGKLSGSKYQLTSGSSGPVQSVVSSSITLPNVGHTCLWDVDGSYSTTSGYSYYVVGSGGKGWYKSYGSDALGMPQQMSNAGGESLRSIVRKGSSDVYFAAGSNASMRTYSGGSSLSGSRIVPFTLNKVYFSSPSVGMVVGDRSVIRYTLDGGDHWRILKLASGQTRTHKNLLAAWCNEAGVGLLGGEVDRLWSVNLSLGTYANTGVSGTTAVGISSIQDIYVDAASGKGYAVGSTSTTTGVALHTTNAGVSFSALSGASSHAGYSSVAPLWASEGSTVMLGCEDGKMYLASGSGVSGTGVNITGSTGVGIADLVFTDAFTCYAVGVSGVLKKGVYVGAASATLPLTYSLTSTDWQWSNAVSSGSGTTAKINSIAMRNNHEGVVVGAGAHYVRFLTNYAGVYSQRFWYDKLGRIVLSQNTKQHDNGTYSYSLYDAQGRVQEAGVKEENTSTTGLHMHDVQGADVGGAFNPLAIEVSSTTGSSSASPFMQWITQGANTSTGVNATRTEVTRTVYDEPLVSGIGSFTQNNLRKRVSSVVYQKVYHSDASDGYTHATHYSYDIHGNVNELVQDNPEMAVTSSLSDQRYKHLEYDYDLISGKVNRVSYQRGARDAWHHWYEYDADNRITQVYTSTHPDPIAMAGTTITDPTVVGALWEQDSKYFYYAHGPLMRQELGSNQVQGVDYAYTLQGWIKGINSNALDATRDMGHDGSGTGLNGRFARDVASFSLSYYEGDFSSVASTGAFSSVVGSDLEAESHDLYNGNIRIMQTTLMENNGSGALTASNLGMAYKYDQLNRLKQAKGFTQYTPSTNSWSASSGAAGEHNNFFTFDANGNILTQQRYEGSTLVDNLTYQYATNSTGDLLSNRLYSVDDAVTNTSLSATDMEDMPAYINGTPNTSNNYTYTQIGELKSDAQEEISEIHWRVDSKISEITRTSGSAKKNLKFEYDAMGNRVAKHVYGGSVLESSTYYVRDAQGNVMGVYEHKMDAENAVMEYKLIERNIYGSAQVGICKDTVDLNITNAAGALTQATYYHARQLNHRQYSLSNHLGNVLTTIGDGKAATDSNSDGVIDYYTAYIISVSDYSPFGVELTARSWSIEEYRKGFNGQEKTDEISGSGNHYTAEYWEMDPRLGRRWNLDPKPVEWESGYAVNRNNPIWYEDPEGDFPFRRYEKGDEIKIRRWFKVVAVIKVVDFEEVKGKGVRIQLEYTDKKTGKTDFNWIQTIRTTDPLGTGKPNEPYNDPNPSDDPPGADKPFYYTDQETAAKGHKPGETDFFDAPQRRPGKKTIKWEGELSVVGKNAKGEYENIKNLKYGFKLKSDGTIKIIKLRDRKVSKFQKKSIESAK